MSSKTWITETGHRNLVWMGTSLVAKIIRWQIYLLEGFNTTIRHIKSKDNVTADWLSAYLSPIVDSFEFVAPCTPADCFFKVNGGRMGHPGALRTLKLLNK